MSSKASILQFLEENRSREVSGNEIAAALGISRNAVWKVIHQLEAEGYAITAVNKKGYRLSEGCDVLSEQSIRPFIHNTSFYSKIQVYKLLESTNLTAKELANAGAPAGTVVIAEQQSAGRGRLGRSFYSPAAAGIYMTVLLRPQESTETSMLITSAAGIAVCRAVQTVAKVEPQIKWVNDVYLDGRKLCGILTEASMNFEAGNLEYLVIGIGVNMTDGDFPPELRDSAISLAEKNQGEAISRSRLIGEILNELEIVTADLEKKTFLSEYRRRSFILGSEINIISPQGTERATALDIDDHGYLVVRMADGTQKSLSSGEISVRKV